MSEIIKPKKYNTARATNYVLNLGKIPDVEFWVQTCNIPTISTNEITIGHPVHGQTYIPSSTAVFSPFVVTFLVDEDYHNYIQLMSLLLAPSNPDVRERNSGSNKFTGSLHILSNNKNPNDDVIFTFHGMFPTLIGEIGFNNENPEPVVTDVTFQIDYMTVGHAGTRAIKNDVGPLTDGS
jgi:hypothetical protein